MQRTGIEYLTHTWNPIAMRCTEISSGCDHCWHHRMANRLAGVGRFTRERQKAYSGEGPPILLEDELAAPLRHQKPARVGVQFMGDLFHELVHDEWIHLVIALASMAPQHTFVFLTKRIDRACELLTGDQAFEDLDVAHSMAMEEYGHHVFDVHARRRGDGRATAWQFDEDGLPPNVMFGASVEDQKTADGRVPLLLQIPAAVHFVSLEPLLSAVDLAPHLLCIGCGAAHPEERMIARQHGDTPGCAGWVRPGLVICGAETGPGKRPMDLDWARSVRDQCAAANVPFFFKVDSDGRHELDGRIHEAMPV